MIHKNKHSYTVLGDNEEAWKIYKNLIRSSKKTILIVIWYVFFDDPILIELIDLLKEKIDAGIEVTIIYADSFLQEAELIANEDSDGISATLMFTNMMRSVGAKLISFTSIDPTRSTHRKALIIDEEIGILGSRNVNKLYYFPHDRYPESHIECDILIEDPKIVKKISKILLSNKKESHIDLDDNTSFVQSVPKPKWYDISGNNDNPIEDAYEKLISLSKKSIVIVNPSSDYLWPLKIALHKALKRGVKVKLLVNTYKQTQIQSVSSRTYFNSLKSFNNFILQENQSSHLLHAKYAIFDETVIVIGSFNFDQWSYEKNSELILIRKDSVLADQLSRLTKKIEHKFFSGATREQLTKLQKAAAKIVTYALNIIEYIAF